MITELNEWMDKFADVRLWDYARKQPQNHVKEYYPYFFIDLLAAWENEGRMGARKILNEYNRRWRNKCACILQWNDCKFRVYPEGVRAIKVTNQELISFGYERYFEEGLFEFEDEYFREIVWHRHDGYGEAAGTVEVSAWK